MEIEIKPFVERYSEQCADLLQYLWKEDSAGRLERFKWAYLQNPNTKDAVTAVIAVNENDEVLGFRGYHTLSVYFGNQERRVAYIADTVVSPNARRQGILQKMTSYSFQFLLNNGIYCISNLGPSWPPYHGYKKLDFVDLHEFTSRYKIYAIRLVISKLFKCKVNSFNDKVLEKRGNVTYFLSRSVPDDTILSQINDFKKKGIIMPCRNLDVLKWKAYHPNTKYVFAYALDENNVLKSFLWFKTYGNGVYNLGLYQHDDKKIFRRCYKLFNSICAPIIVAAWDWAITEQSKKSLNELHFYKIPFLNRLRKNPPAIVRTLVVSDNGLKWDLDGIDIRRACNWIVDKIEGDSF
jgi:hypothetical protein